MHEMMESAKEWFPYGNDKPLGHNALYDMDSIFNTFYNEKNNNYEELFRRIESKPYHGENADAISAMLGKSRVISLVVGRILGQRTLDFFIES